MTSKRTPLGLVRLESSSLGDRWPRGQGAPKALRLGRAETILVVSAASVLSTLDLFVVNLAFPAIRDTFHGASNRDLSWVLTVYSVLIAACLIAAGRFADYVGRKAMFRTGLAVFGAASAACAAAPNLPLLVAARAVQGMGAAIMLPTSLGLLLASFPRQEHTRAVASWAAAGSVAAVVGPLLSGFLLELGWRFTFLLNVPIAWLAAWRGRGLVESHSAVAGPPDIVGAGLLSLSIGLGVTALCYAPGWGLASVPFLSAVLGAALLGMACVRRCRWHPSPALELAMFGNRAFLGATVGTLLFFAASSMMLLGGTLFLANVEGWSAVRIGAALALGPAIAGGIALVVGRLHASSSALILVGSVAFALGSGWWFVLLDERSTWLIAYAPGSLLFGTGAGVLQTAFVAQGTAALPAADYATGSAVLGAARQIGAAAGVALFVILAGEGAVATDFAPIWLAMGLLSLLAGLASAVKRPPIDRLHP